MKAIHQEYAAAAEAEIQKDLIITTGACFTAMTAELH